MKMSKSAEAGDGVVSAKVSVQVGEVKVSVKMERRIKDFDGCPLAGNEFMGWFALEVEPNPGQALAYRKNLAGVSYCAAMNAIREFVKENLAYSMQRSDLAAFLAECAWSEHLDVLVAANMQ